MLEQPYNDISAFIDASERFEQWVRYDALPLWAAVGRNPNTGGHIERISANGQPDLSADVRMRVQSRQIFVFSYAHYANWLSNAEPIAKSLWSFCESSRSGVRYPQATNAQGLTLDSTEDIYDYAFHILANGWFYKAFGDQEKLQHAYDLAQHLDDEYECVHGGWLEGNYDAKYRRQNPHMHLFEAYLALYEITDDKLWLLRVNYILGLFESALFHSDYGALLEYFNNDWSIPDDVSVIVTEPGHMYEWVWLLTKYQTLSGEDISELIAQVYAGALRYTEHPGDVIFDAVNLATGERTESRRCWPLTEAIKAHSAMYLLGNQESLPKAQKCIETLMSSYFIGCKPGMYIDKLDANGQVANEEMPASTMYHILVAAKEASIVTASVSKETDAVVGG